MSDTPLSQYLRLLRSSHEYTQDDLAKYLGITRATYSHYENARLIPPTDALYKLSAFYKVSLGKLVRLSVISSAKRNEDIKAAEYVISDEDIEYNLDMLYKDFLANCSDMTPKQLNKWITIDDRELVYNYHRLSGREKRLMSHFMKMTVISRQPKER